MAPQFYWERTPCSKVSIHYFTQPKLKEINGCALHTMSIKCIKKKGKHRIFNDMFKQISSITCTI